MWVVSSVSRLRPQQWNNNNHTSSIGDKQNQPKLKCSFSHAQIRNNNKINIGLNVCAANKISGNSALLGKKVRAEMANVMKPVTTPYLYTIVHIYTRRHINCDVWPLPKNPRKKIQKKKMCKIHFCRSIDGTQCDFQKYFYVMDMGREI